MTHETHVEQQLDEILTELKSLKEAFPLDERGQVDVTGHRHFHEAKIAAAVAEEAFWRELKLDLATQWTKATIVSNGSNWVQIG